MQQIIALGGGGFSEEPDNLLLDRYILEQTRKPAPAVCFLGQASAESADYTLRFYRAFSQLDAKPTHIGFYSWPIVDPEPILLAQDVIYVGGGNTRNLLALWQAWDLPRILRQALANGTILAGISAGANCWFEQGLTDSISPEIAVMDCLGVLPGSFCPHYDGEVNRRPAFHRFLAEGKVATGYAADNGAAFHFLDGRLERIVSSRPDAHGYRLSVENGQPHEEQLETVYLGS
jgi:dipeptidase E